MILLYYVFQFCYTTYKLDKQSSYVTTFSCSFGRYRYIQLPFGAALEDDRQTL